MIIAAISVALHFEHSRSLKEKRRLLKSIIEKTKHRFNVSVTEVSGQNLWQKSVIGISYVSLNQTMAHKQLQSIRNFIESLNKATITQVDYEILKKDV